MLSRWTKNSYLKIKEELRLEFKAMLAKEKPEVVLQTIRERLADLGNAESSLLERFLLLLFLLSHHLQFGGLGSKEISSIFDDAYTILRLKAVNPQLSKLSFLLSDLYVAQSQIFRLSGKHILAFWFHQRGAQHQNRSEGSQPAFFPWVQANRAFRLGQGERALRHYQEALAFAEGKENDLRPRISLNLLKCLRLTKRYTDADAFEKTIGADLQDGRIKREVEWESHCRSLSRENDIGPLLQFANASSDLPQEYLLELFFWRQSVQHDRYAFRFAKMKSLSRKGDGSISPLFWQAALAFEKLQDGDIPLEFRLKDLADLLESASGLEAIENELLLWLASTRWLARNRLFDLAAICLAEYQALSWRLSEGKDGDALNIAGDLLEKAWFQGGANHEAE